MKIDILCVGKIKEKFFRDAIAEYMKRMSRYATMNIIEVADEKTPDNASENVIQDIISKEASRLSKYIPDKGQNDTYIITLEINGKELTSEKLADKIASLNVNGVSHIIFIIGGSLGLHESIIKRADFHLSFSPMTFPHQLMRVILLEQIYRSFRIINNEPYHK
jgi:23S rRNA (pseudouridine1915-N3)-methyltransferase